MRPRIIVWKDDFKDYTGLEIYEKIEDNKKSGRQKKIQVHNCRPSLREDDR